MSLEKVSVSIVSYTNSKPFLYGLQNTAVKEEINLSLDTPADCAHKLISGQAQIGLVPVAAIDKIKNAKLITDYGIAAVSKVDSVLLLSNAPLAEIKTVMLDYQSMTSVKLVKVLAESFWKRSFVYENAQPDYEKKIVGNTAGVVIGDRALELKNKFKFVFDLSEEWFNYTQLPFVFAVWVTNTQLKPEFTDRFNNALKHGISNIDAVVKQLLVTQSYNFDVALYLHHSIKYFLTKEMKQGMNKFLSEW